MKRSALATATTALAQIGLMGMVASPLLADSDLSRLSPPHPFSRLQPEGSHTLVSGSARSLAILPIDHSKPVSDSDKRTALRRTVVHNAPVTSVVLTPSHCDQIEGAIFAGMIAENPSLFYQGKIMMGPTTKLSGSVVSITLQANANATYVFDLSLSPVPVWHAPATTGTFTVAAPGSVEETDTVQVPAGTNPTDHIGFVVTAASSGPLTVNVSSPDTYWNFNRCTISCAAGN
jgi:hypothetical protein